MTSNIGAAAFALATTAAAPALAAETRWEIDPVHSVAQFKVRHLMVSHVRGQLGRVTGVVFIDDKDLTRSRVEVTIDARGIDTREPSRDEHLRSKDFLHVAQHPMVTFRSTKVKRAGRGLEVLGDLTMRGVTRPVTLQVDELSPTIKDPDGPIKRAAAARASLSRKEWGLNWNQALEAGGVLVGDRVEVEIEVQLTASPTRS